MYRDSVPAGTSATLIRSIGNTAENITIRNLSPITTVYVGGASVTTSTGLPLTPGSEVRLFKVTGAIYGITAGGVSNLNVAADVF